MFTGLQSLFSGHKVWGVLILPLVMVLAACDQPADKETSSDNTKITIKRDTYGTPHIYADDHYGLYYGYGYVLAEDRLYQLEILKHSTQGSVASVLGADYVDFDQNQRTLFWPEDVKSQLADLPETDRDIFRGMAAGINARIKEVQAKADSLMPLEFTQNDVPFSSWSDYDVAMLFVGSMLLRYGDFNTELENQNFLVALTEKYGAEIARNIFDDVNPSFTPGAPMTVQEVDWPSEKNQERQYAKLHLKPITMPDFIPQAKPASAFSNAFVLSSKFLKDDRAILINGPQFGWYVPAYTYSAGFHMPGWDAVGNAPVGYPLPMFGYNDYITWGTTWGASDNVDIFRETLNPDNPDQYKYQGVWRDLQTRAEVIKVKGAEDITFTAKRSVHGPIIHQDEAGTYAYAKSRGWQHRELETLMGWIAATKARNHAGWLAAVKKSGLNVNWYFADQSGNIAYFAGGAYPDRADGHDNRLPVSGEGDMDWRGIKPREINPQVFNPTSGYIANWNNRPALGLKSPDEWWYSWTPADRVETLDHLITKSSDLTAQQAWDLMMAASYVDPNVIYFKPLMMAALKSTPNKYSEIIKVLDDWDGTFQQTTVPGTAQDHNSRYRHAGNALFRQWLTDMLALTLADDLPGPVGKALSTTTGYGTPDQPTAAGLNISVGTKILYERLQGRTTYDFLNGETANDLWLKALDMSLAKLTKTYGSDMQDWQLPVPATRMRTKNFLGIPQALSNAQMDSVQDMNRGTENNMTIFTSDGHVTGYEVVPPGQSGFIAPSGEKSPHYADQLDMFANHGKKPVWLNADDVDQNTVLTKQIDVTR